MGLLSNVSASLRHSLQKHRISSVALQTGPCLNDIVFSCRSSAILTLCEASFFRFRLQEKSVPTGGIMQHLWPQSWEFAAWKSGTCHLSLFSGQLFQLVTLWLCSFLHWGLPVLFSKVWSRLRWQYPKKECIHVLCKRDFKVESTSICSYLEGITINSPEMLSTHTVIPLHADLRGPIMPYLTVQG